MGYDPNAFPYSSLSQNSARIKNTNVGKKGSLLGFVREQKARYPEKIILTKVGEFYEAFGLDAILLVEVSIFMAIMSCSCFDIVIDMYIYAAIISIVVSTLWLKRQELDAH